MKVDHPPQDPQEKKNYSFYWFLLSAVFLVSTIWYVVDETWLRRPWKKYQNEFNQKELKVLQESLTQENSRLQTEESEKIKALEQEEEKLKKERHSAATLALVKAKESKEEVFKTLEQDRSFTKADLDEVLYLLDHARLHGEKPEKLHKQEEHVRQLEDYLKVASDKAQKAEEEFHVVDEELKKKEAEILAPQKQLEKIFKNKTELLLKVKAVRERRPEIKQVVAEGLGRFGRVDRCETCHVGINRTGFEDWPQPFTTHPRRAELFGSHPPEKFGCTACHHGNGRALTEFKAHAYEVHKKGDEEEVHYLHHWDEPMFRKPFMEAACNDCHGNQFSVPQGKTWQYANKLFVEMGCHGCHLVSGFETVEKAGPPLGRVASKVYPEWLVSWIQNPQEYNPHTRMPNFRLKPEESVAISAFLLDLSEKDYRLPETYVGGGTQAITFGKELFETIGCRGCHVVDGVSREKMDAYRQAEMPEGAGEFPVRDHGPDLTRIGEKATPQWIFNWVKNPKHYNPESRMPSLRLSEWEARSLTAYLLSLSTPKPEDVALRESLKQATMIEDGRKLVAKRGCYGCHTIEGFEKADRIGPELSSFATKTTDEMFFGTTLDKNATVKVKETWEEWARNKLRKPDVYDTERVAHLMPTFNLTDREIDGLLLFLRAQDRVQEKPPWAYEMNTRRQAIDQGQRLVAHYNCNACHVIESKGGTIRAFIEVDSLRPPNLLGVGQKLQAEWLFNFLHRPTPVRPWLKVRMPSFQLSDEDFTALVRYFAALDGVDEPYKDLRGLSVNAQSVAKGHVLFTQYDCLSCHVLGTSVDSLSAAQLAKLAPNLRLARNRIRAEWIEKWLADPGNLMPGTRMPAFWSAVTAGAQDEMKEINALLANSEDEAEKATLKEELDQKTKEMAEQKAAIKTVRDYLLTLGQ